MFIKFGFQWARRINKKAIFIVFLQLILISGCTMKDIQINASEKEIKRTYYSNGKIKWIKKYINGKLNGVSKLYGEDGKLISDTYYKDDIKTRVVLYSEDARILTDLTITKDGKDEYNYQKMYWGTLRDQLKIFKRLNPIAYARIEASASQSKIEELYKGIGCENRDGLRWEYHSKNGKAHGSRKDYYCDGKLNIETIYEEGEIVKKIEYNQNGLIKDS